MKKYFLLTILGLVLAVLLTGIAVFAFQGPSSVPPAGNIPAPLNTGAVGQTKQGGLIINGELRTNNFCLGGVCRPNWNPLQQCFTYELLFSTFPLHYLAGLVLGAGLLGAYQKFFSGEQEALAGIGDNVSGWAWSETIGQLSFNCTDQASCSTADYGVKINPQTGNFSKKKLKS